MQHTIVKMKSKTLLCLSSVVAMFSGHALAQEYPTKPVRMVVPFAPGGPTDVIARLIAQKLTEAWGHQVVIDNRAGAGGNIGMEVCAKSPPDGYTVCVMTVAQAIAPAVYRKLPFDPVKDFAHVTLAAQLPSMLTVHPSLPVKNVKDLVAYSMSQPLSYGSSGVGTVAHIGLEFLTQQTGAKFVHVPYKGGGQSLLALLSGEIHMYPGLLLSAGSAIKSGKARPLAVLSLKRIAALPDVPTVAEQGFPGFKITNSYALFAPAGTPRVIVAALNRHVGEFMNSPLMAQKLASEGSQAAERMTPEEFKALFVREYDEVERQIHQIKVKIY